MKLLDPDDKVRTATCKLYSQLDYETALHHVSEDSLRHVAGRSLDKKVGPIPITALLLTILTKGFLSLLYGLKPCGPLESFLVLHDLKCKWDANVPSVTSLDNVCIARITTQQPLLSFPGFLKRSFMRLM